MGSIVATVCFAVIVVVALSGLLGVRTRTTWTRLGDGTTIEVRYGWITRPGLATPWSITVHRAGGFDGQIVVRTTNSYFELFDENGLDPDPASATQDADELIWAFEPPSGDTFTLSFDARIEPGAQWGRDATTVVEVDGARGAVSYRTWVMP
jgi:hypothetical protein